MRLPIRSLVAVGIICLVHAVRAYSSRAEDYTVEKLNAAPPAAGVSKEISDQLEKTGVRVARDGMPFCELWMCKSWATIADFKPTAEVAYPFTPGELVGLARFARKGSDFRDQDIKTGVYTLRYAQQPVNGAHVGTSQTRDFCLLTEAAKDTTAAVLDYETLTKKSAEAAGSAHPALLCLLKPSATNSKFPAVRHHEDHDWWIVAVQGQARGAKGSQPLAVEMVIVGKAAE